MTTSVGDTEGLLRKDFPHPTLGVGFEGAVKLTLLSCCCHIHPREGVGDDPICNQGQDSPLLLLPCLSHLQREMKSVVWTLKLVRHLRLGSP